ncbi:MAG: hypothetical protein ACKVOH_02080, partial [Chlamydiales bacterium]
KLDSAETLDDYIEQKLVGPLLVLEKLTKQNGRQILTGHLFNTTRTEMESIELATSSNTALANSYSLPATPPVRLNHFDLEDDIE